MAMCDVSTIHVVHLGLAELPVKGHIVNSLDFRGPIVSVTTTQHGYYNAKTAIGNMTMNINDSDCVSVKLYSQKQAAGPVQPMDSSLLTPVL